jgi:hypothetical protein
MMKINGIVFWVMTPCSVVVGYQRFGGPCYFHLHTEDGSNMTSYHITAQCHNPEDYNMCKEFYSQNNVYK